ncbi:MAG: type IX secretion system protein PorQ [Psychroflexus maritimus]
MQKIYFLVISLVALVVNAQVGGQDTYQFLNMPVNPLHGALGGKNVTMHNYDPSGVLINPSLVNEEMQSVAAINYMNLAAGINFGSAAYAYKLKADRGTIQAGISYLGYGDFEGFDELGNPTNDFTGTEAAFSVGYAYRIPETKFNAGLNVRLITSRLEQYSSFGLATDFSVAYIDPEKKWVISAVLRNFGAQLKAYDEVNESLPTELLIGISKQLENVPIRWHLTFENLQQWDLAFRNPNRDETDIEGNITEDNPNFINNFFRHTVFGAELFPDGGFSVRVGYSFRRSQELGLVDQNTFAGLSGGFMIKFNKLRFQYTFMRLHQSATSNLIGLNLKL